jgi:hypothetical protein
MDALVEILIKLVGKFIFKIFMAEGTQNGDLGLVVLIFVFIFGFTVVGIYNLLKSPSTQPDSIKRRSKKNV